MNNSASEISLEKFTHNIPTAVSLLSSSGHYQNNP